MARLTYLNADASGMAAKALKSQYYKTNATNILFPPTSGFSSGGGNN